jgi:hypothetical protein
MTVMISVGELELLQELPDQMRALYTLDDGDPARTRLFPRAYLDPTEEEAELEWEAIVHPGLLRDRLDALGLFVASLEEGEPRRRDRVRLELDEETARAWLGILNDVRLAIGVRLGITEEMSESPRDPSDPRAAGLAAYDWLTYLQASLIDELL